MTPSSPDDHKETLLSFPHPSPALLDSRHRLSLGLGFSVSKGRANDHPLDFMAAIKGKTDHASQPLAEFMSTF